MYGTTTRWLMHASLVDCRALRFRYEVYTFCRGGKSQSYTLLPRSTCCMGEAQQALMQAQRSSQRNPMSGGRGQARKRLHYASYRLAGVAVQHAPRQRRGRGWLAPRPPTDESCPLFFCRRGRVCLTKGAACSLVLATRRGPPQCHHFDGCLGRPIRARHVVPPRRVVDMCFGALRNGVERDECPSLARQPSKKKYNVCACNR